MLTQVDSESLQHGLIMVKPHAFNSVLDIVVGEILHARGMANLLSQADPLIPVLSKLVVGNPIVRDLAAVSYGHKIIELFYGDKVGRRYYPLIQECYLGKVAFIPYLYRGQVSEMPQVYKALKGETQIYDSSKTHLNKPSGIRGLLGEPYRFFDNVSSEHMDDKDYRKCFLPVINNFIHVSDSEIQTRNGIQLCTADGR